MDGSHQMEKEWRPVSLASPKDRYLERFEYIVDGERLDKEARMENNGACIFGSAMPQAESPRVCACH